MTVSSRRVLKRQEEKIHSLLGQMNLATEQAITNALQCFFTHDLPLAQTIIDADTAVNALQYQVEQECFTTIALQQPVAGDLRTLFSCTHVAIELERIADHAADIARIVIKMDGPPDPAFTASIDALGQQCRQMLARVMTAYTNRDVQLAREIAAEDEQVDSAEERIIEAILARMCAQYDQEKPSTHTLWVVHNIERIGDRVTNIAEQVVFLVSGDNVDLNQ